MDIRIRVSINGELRNFHLVNVALFDGHDGKGMFKVVVKILDSLLEVWRKRSLVRPPMVLQI